MKNLVVEHVVADIYSDAAGPTYAVTRLCEEIAPRVDIRLHALTPRSDHEYPFRVEYYDRLPIPRALGISRPMRKALAFAAQSADTMHVNGLWMMPNVYPERATRGTSCSLVLSPHGMLEEWALAWSKYRKALFNSALQRRTLERVDCFHATSDNEAEAIRAVGLKAPIAIIPIGIDLPGPEQSTSGPERQVVLYLGRLHPKKNVEALITAWTRIQESHPQWNLQIVGDGQAGYVDGLRRLQSDLGASRVSFVGSLFGADKDRAYSEASLYVLPTHSENFGITVVEALSHGTSVITTKGTPWQELPGRGCGWWIDPSSDALAAALDEALKLGNDELRNMGERGRDWMREEFSWETIGEKMIELYSWLRDGGTAPPFVLAR